MPANLRDAVRLMQRTPGLTAVALASIAIGISASAVVFAAVQAVFALGVLVVRNRCVLAAASPACLLPARRAAKLDPVLGLRQE